MDNTNKNNPNPAQTPTVAGVPDPFPAASSDPPAAPEPTAKSDVKKESTTIDTKPNTTQEQKKEATVQAPIKNQIFISDSKPKGKRNKGIIATVVAILLLVGGVAAGVYLVDNQQLFSQKASSVAENIAFYCSGVVAYDSTWKHLENTDLATLKPGDTVKFTVTGNSNTGTGTFGKAKFTINGVELAETTLKRDPALNEFYQEYTIPEGVEDFSVTGQIYHSVEGWI